METKVCCVTGHRDIPTDRAVYVEQALRREVLAAIEDGYTRFISGFAEGTDLMFAAIVAEQKEYVFRGGFALCGQDQNKKHAISRFAANLR